MIAHEPVIDGILGVSRRCFCCSLKPVTCSLFSSPDRQQHSTPPGAGCVHQSEEPAKRQKNSRIAVGRVPLAHSRAHNSSAAGSGRRHPWQRQTAPHRFAVQQAASSTREHSQGCRILAARSRRECVALPMQYRSRKTRRPVATAGEMASRFQGSFRREENKDKPRLAS